MDIENRKDLKSRAKQYLEQAPAAPKLALSYAAILTGISLFTNAVNYFLGTQISGTGGLSNLGLRSMLSTVQTMLPLVLNFLLICLGLGFTGAMLRVSRGQYASLRSMKVGFERFWVLLRATLLQGGLYVLAGMAAYTISMQLFFLTPMSKNLLATLAPMMSSSSPDIMALLENPLVLDQMAHAMIPLYGITIVLFLLLCAPIYYRLILTKYMILDNPGMGALAAMQLSRQFMKKKCMQFFKLDLSLWPYYVLSGLGLLTASAPAILSLLGIQVSLSPTVLSLVCFLAYLAITFAATLLLQPHMEVTHALAYEALKPRVQSTGGAVLGNIFDLAREQMQENQNSDQF